MVNRPPITLDQGIEAAFEALADGDPAVAEVLDLVQENTTEVQLRNFVIDVIDMQMRGGQIHTAWLWASRDPSALVEGVSERNEQLVEFVNNLNPNAEVKARRHGDQRHISPVDHAVQDALARAQAKVVANAENAELADHMNANQEAIHNFFLAILKGMQQSNHFQSNFTVNLGLEGAYSATFVIALAEIKRNDGQPVDAQPQDENKRVLAEFTVVPTPATDPIEDAELTS